MSEDCLFADIYAPFTATASGKVKGKRQLLPVLVNIQGGGFSTNANPHLDGSPMAARGIVVVTFNYRVGPYGFLASKEIIKDKSADLNVGLLDQRELLKWVKKHIRQVS